MSSDFPERLARNSQTDPRALVKAKDGAEILSYENDTGELPVTILIRYARLVNLPLENLVDDSTRLVVRASAELTLRDSLRKSKVEICPSNKLPKP